jgi:hypothetical protein
MRSPCCLCILLCACISPPKFLKAILVQLPVCVCVYPSVVARQRLGKHVPVARNIHTAIAELMYASFSIRPVTCQGKVAD